MKIIVFNRGNAARAYKLKPWIRIWEAPDGYHPIDPDAVLEDEERIQQSLIFLYEGVLYPDGSIPKPSDLRGDLLLSKVGRVRIKGISTLRARMWAAIAPYMIFIIIGVVAVTMIFLTGPEIIKVIK